MINHYFAPKSPRELNLSYQTRSAVLRALHHTTHPSAFLVVRELVEANLRRQSHPNFIRWAIGNSNKPRVLFVRHVGSALVIGGLILGILLALSHHLRWWRFFVAPVFLVGFSIGLAAYRGVCMIAHSTHCRGLRPWEQFGDCASINMFSVPDDEAALSTDDVYIMSHLSKRDISLDTFGSSNSYGHELWVDKYKRAPWFRKIFTPKVWVEDRKIRSLQDRIVIQSHFCSILMTIPLTILFLVLPVFNVI